MWEKWIEHGRRVLDIEIEALQGIREKLGTAFGEAVERLAACRGRVAVTGIGKSGLVGRKIAATLSSTGTPAFFLHPVEGMHGDLGLVRREDVVLAISSSGETAELLAIIPALRNLGASVIALTSGLQSRLAGMADIVLDIGVQREACPLNIVPTSSTTATLALGDALAVCLMEHKSFTSGDFYRYHPGGALGQRLALGVKDLMHTENLPLVPAAETLREALCTLDAKGFGAVFLIDDAGRLVGILTDGDIRRMLRKGCFEPSLPVSTVMQRTPAHATAGMRAADILDIMENRGITILPVVTDDMIVIGAMHLHDALGKGSITFSNEVIHHSI